MAMGKAEDGEVLIQPSSGVVDVDEYMLEAKFLGQMRPQCWGTITLGGMVATSKKTHACFMRQMRLGFGDFAGDEGLRSSCVRALRRARRGRSSGGRARSGA